VIKNSITKLILVVLLVLPSLTHAGGLTIGSGCQMALNDGALNVGGDVAVTGTLTVGSGSINLIGNWSNSGTFTPGTSTVTFNGANQTISGSTTFYKLTKSVTTPATPATLTFQGGSTNKTTITNTLTLNGISGQLLSLRSDSAAQWEIDPLGTRTIQYLDVQGSKNVNTADIDARGKNCTNSTDNTKWIFDGAPTVTTQDVTDVGTNGATGNGNITDLGSSNPSAHGVCWNTAGTPTISDNKDDKGTATATGAFTADITGLTPGTAYHVRAYATNSNGTTYGNDITFTTSSATAPTVTTTDVSSITTTTASSGGNVTSEGGLSVTARGVCWSTSANPTVALPTKTTDGTGPGTFTSNITGLNSNTAYHVRAYATNSNGVTGYGSDITLTTAAPAGTYYVNISTGNDANDGSADAPWKTLHHAISQINGGPAGTYVLHVALGTGTDTYRRSKGEANGELVLSQSNVTIIGESGSAPVIDGTGATSWTKGLDITGTNVTVENLYVTGFSDTDEEGIRISSENEGTQQTEIRRCKLYRNNWGIRVNNAIGVIIRDSEFYQNTTHGIDVTWSSDVEIVGNKVYNNPQYGIRAQCKPEISRNLIYDNVYGIMVEANGTGDDSSPTIKNNVIYQTASGAMSYGIYSLASNGSANPVIYHNTIDSGTLSGIATERTGGSSGPNIRYNIITNFGEYGIKNIGANPSVYYNDVWNNTAGNYSGIEVISSTNKSEDPLYGSYSLQPDSPCINTIPSTEGDPVDIDYPGFKRPRPLPASQSKDMGAYEYVADVTVNYTLPGGTGAATDYRIFTVPLNLGTGADMLAAMESVLGTYDPFHWRAFLYNGTSYNEFTTTQFASHTIKPGMGFWIITTYTGVIPFEGQPAPDGVDYVMDLEPGWHLIGLPWIETLISLSTIKVTDGVNTYPLLTQPIGEKQLTQRFIWAYTGVGGYVAHSSASFHLQDNEGYFFNVVTDKPVRLIIPCAASLAEEPLVDIDPNETNANDDGQAPPPPPGDEPIPDIKVNGQDGPVSVKSGDSVSVSVSLNPGVWEGYSADWWVAARTPFDWPLDWYTYVYPDGWQYGIHVCLQTPLFELMSSSPYTVLDTVLPAGNYIFYFAVDGDMDGNVDATWLDYVEVTVE